ncbi:MAG: sigma factor-like helix-turn-helix DNA-binding protein, partial [Methylomonas sp.]
RGRHGNDQGCGAVRHQRAVGAFQGARHKGIFLGGRATEVKAQIAAHVCIGVAHAVRMVLGRDGGQGIRLVAVAIEVLLRDLTKDAGKASRRGALFLDVRTFEQGFANLLVTIDTEKNLLDNIAETEKPTEADQIQASFIGHHVAKWVQQLADKQRDVICRRYGLCGFEIATLEQVASEIGVTRERVRQIQLDGLKKLKQMIEDEGYSAETIF